MAAITITHTRAQGTLIEGSARGDGVYEILKGLGASWRYFPSLRQIGLGQSRDRAAKTWEIKRGTEALRAAGHEVTVSIDDGGRSTMAEIESERAERAEARAERLSERAERRGERAHADYAKAREMAQAIPFGQPVMPDHHSYGRDMRYRERMGRTYDRRGSAQGSEREGREAMTDAEALDAIAGILRGECGPDEIARITEIVAATGRDVEGAAR